jgi:hypothetical protein
MDEFPITLPNHTRIMFYVHNEDGVLLIQNNVKPFNGWQLPGVGIETVEGLESVSKVFAGLSKMITDMVGISLGDCEIIDVLDCQKFKVVVVGSTPHAFHMGRFEDFITGMGFFISCQIDRLNVEEISMRIIQRVLNGTTRSQVNGSAENGN